jgi:hypothetical protein
MILFAISAELSAIRLLVYLIGKPRKVFGFGLALGKLLGGLGVRPGETGLGAAMVGLALGKAGFGFLIDIVIS